MVRRRLDGTSEPLSGEGGIRRAYETARDSMLILADSGGGKTTALYELAAHLLDAALIDSSRPIPVVVDLASWPTHGGRLEPWLIRELCSVYEVPEPLAVAWLEEECLVPLLDGLDELPAQERAACAAQINAFRRRHGLVRLAVCCRTDAYEQVRGQLRLHEVVELAPVEEETVLAHLGRAGVLLAGDSQKDPAVRQFLSTPLMLAMTAAAYAGQGRVRLPSGTPLTSRARLVEAYLSRRLAEPGDWTFSAERARFQLGRLAQLMRHQGEWEFRLDRLQPDALPRRYQRRMVLLASHVTTVTLAFALTFAIYFPVADAASATWLVLIELVVNGLISSQLNPAGETAIAPPGPVDWRGGRSRGRHATTPVTPNGEIRRSGRQALTAGGGVVLLLSLPLALAGFDGNPQAFAGKVAVAVPLLMVMLVLPVAMRYGGRAYCRHALLRALLAGTGRTPWRFGRLLEEASERRLLVRSGRAYRFPHRVMLEEMARAAEEVHAR